MISGLVRHVSDRVIVLFRGTVVESGTVEEIFNPPCHPYTEAPPGRDTIPPDPDFVPQSPPRTGMKSRHRSEMAARSFTAASIAYRAATRITRQGARAREGHVILCHHEEEQTGSVAGSQKPGNSECANHISAGAARFCRRSTPSSSMSLNPAMSRSPCPRPSAYVYSRMGITIADSTDALILFESDHLPIYYFPLRDIRMDLFKQGHLVTEIAPTRESRTHYSQTDADGKFDDILWRYEQPAPGSPDLSRHASFYWHHVDQWFEEDEEIFVHARDPFKRVDCLPSSRSVRVEHEGRTLAEKQPRRLSLRGPACQPATTSRSRIRIAGFSMRAIPGPSARYKGEGAVLPRPVRRIPPARRGLVLCRSRPRSRADPGAGLLRGGVRVFHPRGWHRRGTTRHRADSWLQLPRSENSRRSVRDEKDTPGGLTAPRTWGYRRGLQAREMPGVLDLCFRSRRPGRVRVSAPWTAAGWCW